MLLRFTGENCEAGWMKAFHFSGKHASFMDVSDNVGFFLTNRNGSFLHLSKEPVSRYNGWFYSHEGRMYRILDDISPVNCRSITSIKDYSSYFERERGSLAEGFFVPENKSLLLYELSEPYLVSLAFDIREAYDSRQWGRNYQVYYERGAIIVEFIKKTHLLEDIRHDNEEYHFFVAIRHDGRSSLVKKWVYRDYSYDRLRSSFPCTRFVFDALNILAGRIAISVSADKDAALRDANAAFANFDKLVRSVKRAKVPAGKNTAYNCAAGSLLGLCTGEGLLAGLPWFFQLWSRDEAVSSKALMLLGKSDFSKKILFRQLEGALDDGRTKNVFGRNYSSGTGPAPSGSADGIGWASVRIRDLLLMNKLSAVEKRHAADLLGKSAENIRRNYEQGGFIFNRALETWMDTAVAGDTREGFRIEIQALQLSMYSLLHRLTGKRDYARLEKELLGNVRAEFWNGKILADGLRDFTPRPNAFIAAYVYPGLLGRDEWAACFGSLLDSLWLDWGGLSSIDKNSPLFMDRHSGEPPNSYHRGDSWFWINNLSAIVMHRADKRLFGSYVKRIYDASTHDILWKGAIGCHSELSSAREQSAEGCPNQAWSSAMFIELANELKKK